MADEDQKSGNAAAVAEPEEETNEPSGENQGQENSQAAGKSLKTLRLGGKTGISQNGILTTVRSLSIGGYESSAGHLEVGSGNRVILIGNGLAQYNQVFLRIAGTAYRAINVSASDGRLALTVPNFSDLYSGNQKVRLEVCSTISNAQAFVLLPSLTYKASKEEEEEKAAKAKAGKAGEAEKSGRRKREKIRGGNWNSA